jgi:hypothetical protein
MPVRSLSVARCHTGLSVEQVENLAARRVATVVPRAFGIEVIDSDDPLARTDPARARGVILHLLDANTRLPADSGPRIFGTVADDQREVRLEVWEQAKSIASRDIADNTHIASVLLTDLPPRPAGTTFEVTFYMTETGLLTVYAIESESRREVRLEIQVSGLTDDEARTAGEALAHYWVSERAAVSVRSEPGWVEHIHREDETTDFDVFLCHNVADKAAVRWTAERLRERGILPWLDETELQPGRPWQEELERQIGCIGAAAVFVGHHGPQASAAWITDCPAQHPGRRTPPPTGPATNPPEGAGQPDHSTGESGFSRRNLS